MRLGITTGVVLPQPKQGIITGVVLPLLQPKQGIITGVVLPQPAPTPRLGAEVRSD